MNDRLVRGQPRSAETGEFGVDAVALQHIGSGYRLTALLIGHRALGDRPVDAPGQVVLGRVDHVLEAAIDNRLQSVEPLLRLISWGVAVSCPPSIAGPRSAPAACAAVGRAAVATCQCSLGQPFLATAVTHLTVSRTSEGRGSVRWRSRGGVFATGGGIARSGRCCCRWARRPAAAAPV